MKKSLVISTIATVLVVVVALTTATFAWFSASSVSQASAAFTLSTAGGSIQITPWDKMGNTWAAAPWSEGGALPLGAYEESYEFDIDASNGATTSTDYTALTGYKPLMPKAELDKTVTNATVTNNVGLPGIEFINANAEGSDIEVVNTNTRPVVARFKIDTISATVDPQIQVTIQVADNAPSTSYTMANNLHFVLFGTSGNVAEATPSFVFGTDYDYVTNGDDIPIAQAGKMTPKYNLVEFDEVTTGANLSASAIFPTISANNRTQSVTFDFSMAVGTSVDCLLYVWFDGRYVTNTSSGGKVNFTLNFVDLNAQQGN